jgi:hypothetical protein
MQRQSKDRTIPGREMAAKRGISIIPFYLKELPVNSQKNLPVEEKPPAFCKCGQTGPNAMHWGSTGVKWRKQTRPMDFLSLKGRNLAIMEKVECLCQCE